MCRRADQPADNGPDCRRAEHNPTGVPAVMDVVDDMMPRWRRAMRTMPPVMRRGNRRASRQNHPSHENRECLDDLVHITPTFPDFLSLHKARNHHRRNLTKTFAPSHSPTLSSLIDFTRPYLSRTREKKERLARMSGAFLLQIIRSGLLDLDLGVWGSAPNPLLGESAALKAKVRRDAKPPRPARGEMRRADRRG